VQPGFINYVDLALDLLVIPGNEPLLLDEDEYDALSIDLKERQETLAAMRDLEERFHNTAEIHLVEGRI
jgi:predicted RNA-binding protein associated with RNAse of E/G family